MSWEGLTPKRDSIDVILFSDRARAARITVASPLGVAHHVTNDVGIREGPLRHVRNGAIAPFPETLNSPHIVTDGRYRGLVRLTFRPVCDVRAENITP